MWSESWGYEFHPTCSTLVLYLHLPEVILEGAWCLIHHILFCHIWIWHCVSFSTLRPHFLYGFSQTIFVFGWKFQHYLLLHFALFFLRLRCLLWPFCHTWLREETRRVGHSGFYYHSGPATRPVVLQLIFWNAYVSGKFQLIWRQ